MEKTDGTTRDRDRNTPAERTLLAFDHIVNDRKHRLRVVLKEEEKSGGDYCQLTVFQEDGAPVAMVRGALNDGGGDNVEFSTHASFNITKMGRHPEHHIPRVVEATIAELIGQGKINRWYSDNSAALSEDAIGLYAERLSRNPRLIVSEPSAKTKYRYMIAARPQIVLK